jgi:hypothetical protein
MSKGTDNLALVLLTEEATVVPVGLGSVVYIQASSPRYLVPVHVGPGDLLTTITNPASRLVSRSPRSPVRLSSRLSRPAGATSASFWCYMFRLVLAVPTSPWYMVGS